MGKNPIVPFLLIMGLGIGVIFFMSLDGLDKKAEITAENAEDEETEDVADFDAASFADAKCVSCHGGNLEGGSAPGLVGTDLSEDELEEIIRDGTDGGMPGGLVPEGDLDEMVDYILSLE